MCDFFSPLSAELILLECEAFACTQHIPVGGEFWLELFSITVESVVALDQTVDCLRRRVDPVLAQLTDSGSRGVKEHRGPGLNTDIHLGGTNRGTTPFTADLQSQWYSPLMKNNMCVCVCNEACAKYSFPDTCFQLARGKPFLLISQKYHNLSWNLP